MVKKISLILLSCFLVVLSVFSINNSPSNYDFVCAEEVVTDLTGYQWHANDSLSFGTDFPSGFFRTEFSINGLAGVSYNTLTSNFIVTDHSFYYYAFRGLRFQRTSTYAYLNIFNSSENVALTAYLDWSWQLRTNEEGYFIFLGGPDTTNANLISWLLNNGTLTYVGVTQIIENVVNNAILNPVVFTWNNVADISSISTDLVFEGNFYFMYDNVLYSVNNLTVTNTGISYTYFDSTDITVTVYSSNLGWSDLRYKVLYFPTNIDSLESYFNDSVLYNFLISNGVFSDYNSYNYDLGYSDGSSAGYNTGYSDGVSYATNMFNGYGPFLYSTWSIVKRTDYSEVLGDLTGRFNSDNFNAFNGGFTFSQQLFSDIENFFIENEDTDGVFKVDFDNYLPISQYSEWVTYNFTFGNELTFILNNGSKVYFDNDSITKSVSLSDYSNFSIVSIIVSFASSFSDYGDFGLSSNANYKFAYQNGYDDGYTVGNSNGYLSGYNSGKAAGYFDGLNSSNQFTFFNLIAAVVDAPIKAFSSLFNFNILGVNILSLLTGLFTLLLVVVVIKFLMGGK